MKLKMHTLLLDENHVATLKKWKRERNIPVSKMIRAAILEYIEKNEEIGKASKTRKTPINAKKRLLGKKRITTKKSTRTIKKKAA